MSSAKKINAFSIFVLFVFLISILYAGIFLVNTANTRKASLEQKSSDIASRLETLAKTTAPNSREFYQGVTEIIEDEPTISAFILDQDGTPSYVWPVGSSFIVTSTDNTPEINTDSFLIQVKNGYFINEKGVTNWSIAFSILTASDIYYRCSHSFIAILTATLLCLMVIAYISVFKTPCIPKEKLAQKIDAAVDLTEEEELEDYDGGYIYDVTLNDDIDTVFDEQDHEVIAKSDEISNSQDADSIPDEFVVEAARHQAAVHAAPKKRVLKESEDPLGLFSDLTGFGWESYLETRLDSELIRAASSEYDLALFIVKIKDVERTHPAYTEICEALLSFFKFRDMVFEFGSDSFAGIVTGMDINGCMSSVEGLYNSLTSILKNNGIESEICIGISTRCFRLIPGARLLQEAKDAVSKAAEENDMPIIAFRVNPSKYKEFLENELAQEPIAS